MNYERILVVDDEKGVVRSCIRILQREGFIVSGMTDSPQVPDLLKQESFDLLLTDIKMPRIDGLELLRIAKDIDPHITVVLITGYGTMEDAIAAIRLGAQGFLMKPFEPRDLVATVKDNLSRRALVRDSLRLQTLLPLLEINQILQVSGGEISLARKVLEIAHKSTGAVRIAWLRSLKAAQATGTLTGRNLVEAAVVPHHQLSSRLPDQAIERVLSKGRPIWLLADGSLINQQAGHPNIVGALLPLVVKGEVVGMLTAETGNSDDRGPFGQIGLELLSVLAGQLAMIIENVQLFQQTEALRTFNEDIIQNMTNGLIAVDQDNCITAFNPAASIMLGYDPNQVLDQPLGTITPETEALIRVFDKALTTGAVQPHREIMIRHQAGHQLPISVSTAPLQGEAGLTKPAGVVGVIEDLSEIKALEAERRRLDRLAALGEMAAVVAHEIRNPVAGIAAGVEYLTRNAPPGSTEYDGAALIQGEVSRINRILEDILFVARPLQLNPTLHQLSTVIERVLQRYQPQTKANQIAVYFTCEDNLPDLYIDGQRMEQVFSNLVINSVQAMRSGGRLTIEVRLKSETDQEPFDRVMVSVSDTGPGIPVDIQEQMFEPFFTTKTKGTGLGLSIAHRILEAHSGAIEVKNLDKQGVCFVISLPVEERTKP